MSESDHQFPVAETFHSTPRFGHSRNFAQFFSDQRDDQVDYLQGIFAFGIFMICLLVIWLLILLILKVFLGTEQIGCAAGGGIIDVNEIKKKKPELKGKIQDMVTRSWRIQAVFVLCGILLPAATGFFLKNGLRTMVQSMEEISSINNDVESVAARGKIIVDTLMREHDNLHKIYADDVLNIERHCPQRANITLNISMTDSGSQVLSTLDTLDELVDEELVYAQRGLEAMFSTTRQVDGWVKWILENDWVPKLFLTVLNVVSLALLCGVLLSRLNVVHFPYKCMLVWLLVPVFIALLVVSTVGTSSIGMAVSLNADFCSGGDSSSPEGTIEEIILSKDVTVDDLSYQSFVYYMDSCTTVNPMDFVAAFQPQIRETVSQAKDFLKLVGEYGADAVSVECGADVSPLVDGAQRLIESLETVADNIDSGFVLADCSTISPILRRIFHGASCNEAIDGLGWMFGSMLAITMLGLTMVTLRAALYNATIRAARRTRADESHREFREYKRYMSQFYEDAIMWKFEPDKSADGLAVPGSFDTGDTSTSSMEEGIDSPEKFVEVALDDSLNEGFYSDDHSSDDSDLSDDSLDHERYRTPCKKSTLVEQIKSAEKMRDLMYVMDDELCPLSPPEESFAPYAPQKYLKNLQRTTQRKVLM